MPVDFAHSFNGVDGEILLWIPDIVAGAVAAARGDGDGQLLTPMVDSVVEIMIDLHSCAKPRS